MRYRKINQKRLESWQNKEKSLREKLFEAKKNGTTKKEKASIQKQIDHAVNQQRVSENHGNNGQGPG